MPTNIRRIARKEIDGAAAELGTFALKPKNIHEARRHLKKLRALLRLVRNETPASFFEREKNAFRDIARKLAPLRDARVLARTVDLLKNDLKKQRAVWEKLQASFEKQEAAFKIDVIKNCLDLLALIRKRVKTWPIKKATRHCLRVGVQETFRRGRNACRKASRTSGNQQLHTLRKRTKDLEYHFRFLKSKRTRLGKIASRRIVNLGDYLGKDHDLAILSSSLNSKKFSLKSQDIHEIRENIYKRRSKLQKRALKLADKIYANKPARFVRKTIDI